MERSSSRLAQEVRKADTRDKIATGGLVRKAGLADEPRDVLLGLLLDAHARLIADGGDKLREKWKQAGATAFGSGK